jgi:hypothetical protein
MVFQVDAAAGVDKRQIKAVAVVCIYFVNALEGFHDSILVDIMSHQLDKAVTAFTPDVDTDDGDFTGAGGKAGGFYVYKSFSWHIFHEYGRRSGKRKARNPNIEI